MCVVVAKSYYGTETKLNKTSCRLGAGITGSHSMHPVD
jgi:hypothetical protein